MQIKIVGCSRKTYWYAKRIGEVFDVVDEDTTDYYIEPEEYLFSRRVLKSDAEVVNENNDRCYEDACMGNSIYALQTLIASSQTDIMIYWNTSEQKIKYQVFTADEEEMETDNYDEVVELMEAYAKIRAITHRNKKLI